MISFPYVRAENQKLEIEKVSKRETWSVELSTSGSIQMSPVRHGHRIGVGLTEDGTQEIRTRSF